MVSSKQIRPACVPVQTGLRFWVSACFDIRQSGRSGTITAENLRCAGHSVGPRACRVAVCRNTKVPQRPAPPGLPRVRRGTQFQINEPTEGCFFLWKSTGSGRVKQSCSTWGVDGERVWGDHGTRFKAVQRICQLRFGQHFQIFLISEFGARKRGDSLNFPRPLAKQVFCTVAQSRMHGSHFHILFHDWRVLQDSEEVGRRAVIVLQFTLLDV